MVIRIPAGLRIIAAEQRSPYEKQPTLPTTRPLLITRRGICGDPLGADCDCPVCMPYAWPAHDAPDAYDFVLDRSLPAFLRAQAGEPRDTLNIYRQFGILDFDVGQPHLCLPRP